MAYQRIDRAIPAFKAASHEYFVRARPSTAYVLDEMRKSRLDNDDHLIQTMRERLLAKRLPNYL